MPSRNAGKRWIWNFRKCDCRLCKVCKHREASKRYYHRYLAVAVRKAA